MSKKVTKTTAVKAKRDARGRFSKATPIIVTLLLDESGSMGGKKQSTIDGANEYINGLRADKDNEYLVSIVSFENNNVRTIYSALPLSEVTPLTGYQYRPDVGGSTNLMDAIGDTINNTVFGRKNHERVLFLIITDGGENASRRFRKADIREKIEALEKDGWTFTYMGSDHDSYAEARSFGVHESNTVNYLGSNIGHAIKGLARSTMAYAAASAAMPVGESYRGFHASTPGTEAVGSLSGIGFGGQPIPTLVVPQDQLEKSKEEWKKLQESIANVRLKS